MSGATKGSMGLYNGNSTVHPFFYQNYFQNAAINIQSAAFRVVTCFQIPIATK